MISCDLRTVSAKGPPTGSALSGARSQGTANFDALWPEPSTAGQDSPAAAVALQMPAQKPMLQAASADAMPPPAMEGKAPPAAGKTTPQRARPAGPVTADGRKGTASRADKDHSAAVGADQSTSGQPPAVQPDPAPAIADETRTGTPSITAGHNPAISAATAEHHFPQGKEEAAVAPLDPGGKSARPVDAAAPLIQVAPVADAHVSGPGETASAGSPAIQSLDAAHAASAASTLQPASESRPSQDQTPAAPARPAAATAPASQLQQAAAVATVVAHSSGPQHITIHLTPPELGSLQVRIDQSAGAPPRIEIKVEHAQTLDLLLHDQPRLHQALDQAGIPADGRHVTLSLDDTGQNSSGGGQRRASGSDWNDQNSSSDPGPESEQSKGTLPAQITWRQGSLDITA